MKETEVKLQSELEEKWCKYRDKTGGSEGRGKNGVPTEGGSARVVHLQPELYSREKKEKFRGDDRRKNKASYQPMCINFNVCPPSFIT